MSKFMFRERELTRILNAWEDGRSVLLVGIRRTGKTRLMKEALRRQKAKSHVHYLDVADYTRLHDFYRDLLAVMPSTLMNKTLTVLKTAGSVPNALINWVRGHVDKVGAFGMEVDLNAIQDAPPLTRYWEPVVAALLKALDDDGLHSEMPVIAIDELPFMLENLLARGVSAYEVTVALASLRKLRDAGLCMIVGGSISLENLLTLHKIPHTVLGGLLREVLPPFSRDQAREFLLVKLQGYPAATALEDALTKLPDYVPHFLDECAHYLKAISDVDEVDMTMDNQVLPAIRRSFLTQFQERLDKNYLTEELACAQALLDQIAQANALGGRIDTTALSAEHNRVLTKLQFDMFIEEAPHLGYRFSLQLLRLWWRSTRNMPQD